MPLVAALLLLAVVVGPGRGPHGTPLPASPSAAVDSARDEFAAGRTWHAARLLETPYRAGELDEPDLLLLARARMGYRDWPGVREVLEGASWLDAVEGGLGWFVLGRAREAVDDPGGAAEAYRRFLAGPGRGDVVPREAVVSRLSRALWSAGDTAAAVAVLEDLESHPGLGSWTVATFLEQVVEAGRPARAEELLGKVDDPEVRGRWLDAPLRARLAAGDTSGAANGYRRLLEAEGGDGLPSSLRVRGARVLGDGARLAGDSAAARRWYRSALEGASGGNPDGAAAGRWLVRMDPALPTDLAVAAGRLADRAGDGRGALAAWDRAVAAGRESGEAVDPRVRVERARLMATVPSRVEEAIREWRELSTHPDPEVGVRALTLWAGVRRNQGRTGDYQTLRRWLVERYPGSSEAAGVVFFRADAAHDRQAWGAALDAYAEVARMAPAVDYAGLSRMRAGQIHLHRGDPAAALAVFEGYLTDFPEGRRWEEAAYWAARTHIETGDVEAGRVLLARLRAEEPFSYYSVLTADLLGEPYTVDLPPGPDPAPPAWLAPALAELDALAAAGLVGAAEARASALQTRAEAEGSEALLSLAEGFNVRGRTLTGINLGWAARRLGEPWSDRLVRIVYPFPYQELVIREAREVGVDPLLLAALIRQESAFVADIVSSAGAVGLMQVMPSTGRDLARALGVANFTPETLESPEVNLHLGARFLVDQLERYGPDLPLVLSAYNAGPSRADRWRTLPEAGDLLRLTERIPFSETRGYVKNVTRNRRLYEALYGEVITATAR